MLFSVNLKLATDQSWHCACFYNVKIFREGSIICKTRGWINRDRPWWTLLHWRRNWFDDGVEVVGRTQGGGILLLLLIGKNMSLLLLSSTNCPVDVSMTDVSASSEARDVTNEFIFPWSLSNMLCKNVCVCVCVCIFNETFQFHLFTLLMLVIVHTSFLLADVIVSCFNIVNCWKESPCIACKFSITIKNNCGKKAT